MALEIPLDFASIACHVTPPGTGGEQIFTFGVAKEETSSWDDAAPQLATILNGFWTERASALYSLTHFTISIGAASPPYLTGDFPLGGAGGRSIVGPAPGTCVVVKKNTTTAGRTGRGRFFIPGIIDNDGVDLTGRLVGAELTDTQDAVSQLLQDINDADDLVDMRVLHDTTSPAAGPSHVVALVVRPLITWLRSREY